MAEPNLILTVDEEGRRELIRTALEVAVPLWIEELKGQPWDYIEARSKVCAQVVAEKGDVILYRSKKKGESAAAFNALAEGVACLSFVPGGADVFGLHFETKREGGHDVEHER